MKPVCPLPRADPPYANASRVMALLVLALQYTGTAGAGAQVLHYAPGNGIARLEVSATGTQVLAEDGAHRLLWRYAAGAANFDSGPQPDATPCHGAVEVVLAHDDLNHDGLVDPRAGDTARLYVSSSWSSAAPSGSTVSAVDITQPGTPRVLWVLDGRALPDLGLLAAGVSPARIRVGGSNRDPRHNVLVFGAGLPVPTGGSVATASGRRLYIVDAQDGRLLWSAAASAGSQTFAAMQAAFAGSITALDLDGDGYTDRLYAGDLSSSLWRFDVWQGQPGRNLLTGGVLAALANPLTPAARGFRGAPDVALMTNARSQPWFSIGIGTQALPGAGVVADNWFFLIRDLHPFDAWSQARYDREPVLHPADLLLVDTPATLDSRVSARGLRVALGSGQVAAQATTAARVAFFTVVEQGAADERFCVTPPTASPIVTVQAIDTETGEAAFDLNGDGRRESDERRQWVPGAQARDQVVIGRAARTDDATPAVATQCMLGTVTLTACIRLPPLVATYWRREDAE